jgi:hypothetical protein
LYTALRATSETLVEILRQAFIADASLGGLFDPSGGGPGDMVVSLNSPQEFSHSQEGLSVWLYLVVRDTDRLNAPPQRISYTEVRMPPLPVRLHYLMTPIVTSDDSSETEQVILGKVLQVFNDHPTLRGADLQGDFSGTDIELNVRLEPLALSDLSQVFDALERSYQLAVSYEVSVVLIESDLQPQSMVPVEEVIPEYGVIVAK